LEAALAHPVFQPVRRWLERLDSLHGATLVQLNAFAEEAGLKVESGKPLRFVPPASARGRYGDYETRVYQSGQVETRPANLHDLFNALAWLAFPQTKARLNALHAAEIPTEGGRRGPRRDLLTLLDEGGAIVPCAEPRLERLVRGFRWKTLFWDEREAVLSRMRILVLGHAVLEQALRPWPGITCKAVFVRAGEDADTQVAQWLSRLPPTATPRDLPPLPIFGFPGWLEASREAAFYDDTRYFRPGPAAARKSVDGSMPSE
jgi:hypothetical protein